jgi:hypothetical protein
VTVSDDVRVRSKPGVSDESRKLTPLLPTGARVFVLDGPKRASGFDWYLVQPVNSRFPFGWVASGREDERWLVKADYGCPDRAVDADLLAVGRSVDAYSNVYCFGSRELTFTAKLGGYEAQCGVDPCCLVTPCWLGSGLFDGWLALPGVDPTYEEFFGFVFHPRMGRAAVPEYTFEHRRLVKVRGHFGDPASARCRPVADLPNQVPLALAVLQCRDQFVVTSIRVLDD